MKDPSFPTAYSYYWMRSSYDDGTGADFDRALGIRFPPSRNNWSGMTTFGKYLQSSIQQLTSRYNHILDPAHRPWRDCRLISSMSPINNQISPSHKATRFAEQIKDRSPELVGRRQTVKHGASKPFFLEIRTFSEEHVRHCCSDVSRGERLWIEDVVYLA